MADIVQNSDVKLILTLIDENGDAYVIDNLNNYEVYVYYLNVITKTLCGTFKKANTGPFSINIEDSATGKISIVINRQTLRGVSGKLFAEVKIRVTADSDFIDSVQNLGTTANLIGTVVKSANNESLL